MCVESRRGIKYTINGKEKAPSIELDYAKRAAQRRLKVQDTRRETVLMAATGYLLPIPIPGPPAVIRLTLLRIGVKPKVQKLFDEVASRYTNEGDPSQMEAETDEAFSNVEGYPIPLNVVVGGGGQRADVSSRGKPLKTLLQAMGSHGGIQYICNIKMLLVGVCRISCYGHTYREAQRRSPKSMSRGATVASSLIVGCDELAVLRWGATTPLFYKCYLDNIFRRLGIRNPMHWIEVMKGLLARIDSTGLI